MKRCRRPLVTYGVNFGHIIKLVNNLNKNCIVNVIDVISLLKWTYSKKLQFSHNQNVRFCLNDHENTISYYLRSTSAST